MASDYFLDVGIPSESMDKDFKGLQEIQSYAWGVVNTADVTGSGLGSGKADWIEMNFAIACNKASPQLMLHCADGTVIPKAVLYCRKSGGAQEVYLTISWYDAKITSYNSAGTGENPSDNFTLIGTKVEYEYKFQKPDGTLGAPVKTGYDIAGNVKL